MDANINHGSSGGPVCNEDGEVVGLTTFGSIENTGGLAAGLNFAIPVDILDEYIDSAGISPKLSRATQLFAQGLYLFKDAYYRSARRKFEEVSRLNNGYPGVYTYMAECRSNIEKGNNRDSGPVEHMLLYGGLIILLLTIIALLAGRRRSNSTSSPS
jgi:S1-C subfamily serine protease